MLADELKGLDSAPGVSWSLQRVELQEALRHISDLPVILTTKNSWFWSLLGLLLGVLGQRRNFLDNMATTIGPVIAIPAGWELPVAEIVSLHEIRHVQQYKWFGFGVSAWLGIPLFALL